jgi:hypothetical protein
MFSSPPPPTSYGSANNFPHTTEIDRSPVDDRHLSQSPPFIQIKPELNKPLLPHEGVARAIALYDYRATQVSLDKNMARHAT